MQQPRNKFSVQQKLQDFTSKVREVVNTTVCEKHGAVRHGQPCWWLHTNSGSLLAICNQRARKMYIGEPSERNRQTAKAAVRKANHEVRS